MGRSGRCGKSDGNLPPHVLIRDSFAVFLIQTQSTTASPSILLPTTIPLFSLPTFPDLVCPYFRHWKPMGSSASARSSDGVT